MDMGWESEARMLELIKQGRDRFSEARTGVAKSGVQAEEPDKSEQVESASGDEQHAS
jgi:hypothetical protein